MNHQGLPIWKASMDLCVYVDTIVKNQERYHRYTIGAEMRSEAKEILLLIAKANRHKDVKRVEVLQELADKCEAFMVSIQLAKALGAFKGFKQFEHSSKLAVDISRQAIGWLAGSARISK
jgi:hypothetical protein